MTYAELLERYHALPPGTGLKKAAQMLEVPVSRLERAKREARGSDGNPVSWIEAKRAEQAAIVERHDQLPLGLTLLRRAQLLGISTDRLNNALRTRKGEAPVAPVRRGAEALPPGAAETWGLISNEPWPGLAAYPEKME